MRRGEEYQEHSSITREKKLRDDITVNGGNWGFLEITGPEEDRDKWGRAGYFESLSSREGANASQIENK